MKGELPVTLLLPLLISTDAKAVCNNQYEHQALLRSLRQTPSELNRKMEQQQQEGVCEIRALALCESRGATEGRTHLVCAQ